MTTESAFASENPKNYMQFGIPTASKVAYTYVGAGTFDDDLIATASYYNASNHLLGTLEFDYVSATNNIATITRTA